MACPLSSAFAHTPHDEIVFVEWLESSRTWEHPKQDAMSPVVCRPLTKHWPNGQTDIAFHLNEMWGTISNQLYVLGITPFGRDLKSLTRP
jgi:hypothetical protein